MTPDAQDLKEEVRANLVARVDELEAVGPVLVGCRAPGDRRARRCPRAARRTRNDGRRTPAPDSYAAMQLRHRVRPKAGFVVRVVVWSLAFIVGTTLAILGATGVLPLPDRARSSG